jgi:predicted transcriptional regulator of viral defense system
MPHKIFSLQQLQKIVWDIDSRRLYERKKKWYIYSLKQWWYILSSVPVDFEELISIANIQYKPSYVSLYTALSRYGVIPETVVTIQSISTRKTLTVHSEVWSFQYRTCPPSRMQWYVTWTSQLWTYIVATLEKAYLDVLYYDTSLQTTEDFEWLRITHTSDTIFSKEKYQYYLTTFPKTLIPRAQKFLECIMTNA